MARPKKLPRVSMTSAQKKEQRRIRREARKSAVASGDIEVVRSRAPVERSAHQEAQFWAMIRDRMAAAKILNDHRERPWWLSVPGTGSSPPYISGYFPCSMFRRGSRWYYGFLFKEHRDAMFKKTKGARKEVTQ